MRRLQLYDSSETTCCLGLGKIVFLCVYHQVKGRTEVSASVLTFYQKHLTLIHSSPAFLWFCLLLQTSLMCLKTAEQTDMFYQVNGGQTAPFFSNACSRNKTLGVVTGREHLSAPSEPSPSSSRKTGSQICLRQRRRSCSNMRRRQNTLHWRVCLKRDVRGGMTS